MISAVQLSREVREPGSVAVGAAASPPAFLVMPTTVARKAVRIHHSQGPAAVTTYLREKLAGWLNHSHASMASNARNTLAGLGSYIAADAADARPVLSLDETTVVDMPGGPVKVRFDAVLDDGDEVAGRVVLWDGCDFVDHDAALIAAVYAHGLGRLYPDREQSTIGVWQARRGHFVEVPARNATGKFRALDTVRRRLPR